MPPHNAFYSAMTESMCASTTMRLVVCETKVLRMMLGTCVIYLSALQGSQCSRRRKQEMEPAQLCVL